MNPKYGKNEGLRHENEELHLLDGIELLLLLQQ
jgi:hypothetical protein